MGVKITHLADKVGQGGAPGLPCQCSARLTMQLYIYKKGGLGNKGRQNTPLEGKPSFFLKHPHLFKNAPIFRAPCLPKDPCFFGPPIWKTPDLEDPPDFKRPPIF